MLDWPCCTERCATDVLAPQVIRPNALRFILLVVCEGQGVRTSTSTGLTAVKAADKGCGRLSWSGYAGTGVARTRLSCWRLACHRGRPHRTSVNVRRNLESFPFMLYLYLWNKFVTAVTAMFSFWTIHSELPCINWITHDVCACVKICIPSYT